MINKIDVILKVKVIENIMKKIYAYLCYTPPFIELFIMGYAYLCEYALSLLLGLSNKFTCYFNF